MAPWVSAFVVALIAISVSLVWEVTPYSRTLNAIDVNENVYNVKLVEAPSVSNPWIIQIVARIFVSSPLGDWLVRRLLDKNGVPSLMELADALQSNDATVQHLPGTSKSGKEFGMGEPLVRLSSEDYKWHVQQAAAMSVEQPAFPNQSQHRPRTVRDYHLAYKSLQTTPTKVLEALLEFVQQTNETLRCVQEVDYKGARLAAAEATQRYASDSSRGIWDGVPVMIKTEIPIKGFQSTSGRQWGSYPDEECLIPARFRRAGAVIVATTVMHEMGVQPTGYNPWYGGPKNPYKLDRFPGGSSSGSAVAVATGMVPVAVGFDGGGSIRIPAAWSGTVGLAVGYNRIPFSSPKANLFSVSKSGPLAGTVQDAADALILLGQPVSEEEGRQHHFNHIMYGGDGPPPPHWTTRWQDEPIKIGVFQEWVSHRAEGKAQGFDDSVYETYQKVLSSLTKSSRYEIVEFSLPFMKEQALAHGLLITSMFSLSMVKELYKGTSSRERADGLQYQPATQIQIKLGQQISALEILACQRIRSWALARWRNVLKEAHVILTPTTPMTALRRPPGSDVLGFTDTSLMMQIMRYIWPGNLVGLPGVSVPAGVDGEGLPIAMNVGCLHWHEADCLSVAADIESMFGEQPRPQFWFDPLSESDAMDVGR